MKNRFEIKGDSAEIYINCKGITKKTIIDVEDLHLANNFSGTWHGHLDNKTKTFYVRISQRIGGKVKNVQLHRLITNAPINMVVDHINHDTLDNRKCNIRATTHKINSNNRNQHKPHKGNVYWSSRRQRWIVLFIRNKKVVYQKHFSDRCDAISHANDIRPLIINKFSNKVV